MLRNCQTRQRDTQTRTRRFVHLSEHQSTLGIFQCVFIYILEIPLPFLHSFLKLLAIFDDTALDHLTEKIVTFTRTLSHTCEDRETVMTLCNIVDELLDKHSLAYAGTTEQTDLTTL